MQYLLSALTGIVLLCAPITLRAQVISEVLWMGSDQSTSDEWLELARLPCASADCPAVDLGGWKITSLNSSGVETVIATLPGGTQLSLEHPLVIARQAAAVSRLAQEPDVLSSSVSLPNTKLLLKLIDAAGTVVDEVDDGVGAPFAGANPSGGTKASMERVDLSVAGTVKENWRTATEARGLDAGAAMLATPGWFDYPDEPGDPPPDPPPVDSGSGTTVPPEEGPGSSSGSGSTLPEPPPAEPPPVAALPPPAHVILSAVLPNPAGKDELGEWIELKNLSDEPAVLTGWKLIGEGSTIKSFALDGKAIDASSALRLTFAETQLSLTNTKFTLSLRDASGVEVSSVSWENAAEDRAYRPNLYSELTMHGTVSRVIDGDTFEVVFDEEAAPDGRTSATVRLIGVDAPESVHPTKKPEPYGVEASIFLKGLMEKKKVELQFDTENWDLYDRMLAYASVDGQVSAQERLLSTGMARVYPDYPFARRSLFDQYELQAKVLRVGIWSGPASSPEYKAPAVIVAAVTTESAPAAAENAGATAVSASVFVPAWSKLGISEVYAHVSASEAGLLGKEWIELRNDGDEALSLQGWKIRVGEGSKAKTSAIAFTGAVAPGGFAVLAGSGETFKLRDSGNALALLAPDGTVVSDTAYPSLKAGEAWVTDAGGCVTKEPTPGSANHCAGKTTVAAAATSKKTKTTTAKKAPAAKKTAAKKTPAPEFLLAQQSLGDLQSRPSGSLTLGEAGGASFWQALTFFLAALALSQGALMGLVAWRSGLLPGTRKASVTGCRAAD
ncbi:MAG TPA: lamin tail domain-containing protein [Candidatus Peribacteria bacterium]|nr:lamin tail domain-containing protein [Candidatus Peribacteria bacterium]